MKVEWQAQTKDVWLGYVMVRNRMTKPYDETTGEYVGRVEVAVAKRICGIGSRLWEVRYVVPGGLCEHRFGTIDGIGRDVVKAWLEP